ncbi:class I SAM-dependent methyltransferase [Solwaraspora sp. WMMD937]|uniref:class I SAM-dependent methyltransferase n=1 Tax=Solwaraspora sp. WMMD937 TaxID=3016090 RepID=UPI00249CEC6A|nr:class I SAM-dependent methyltransferase [Solwaraspora sp. WMMD937]WFE20075.1 class I SAM-dependent methyltransferase [Solwaraspora sp. WMMD937]
MAHPLFRLAAQALNWPLTVLVRPYPRVNAVMWDLQYALGLWRYLDQGRDRAPLELAQRVTPRPRILDLGCGTTVNLALPPGGYRHYHGVDISRAAIRRARALRRPDTSFEAADLLTYRTDERYDVVLFREVLYYFSVDDAVGLLHRAADLLRPGGRVLVWVYDGTTDAGRELLSRARSCGLPVHDELVGGAAGAGSVLVLGAADPARSGRS